MSAFVTAMAVLAGCGEDAREADCKRVRDALSAAYPAGSRGDVTIRESCGGGEGKDRGGGLDVYTPYSTALPRSGSDRLARLCRL